jgi:transposase InsO family protein
VRVAQSTGLSRATVSRILGRHRLSRMRDLEPQPPVQRYEHPSAGDLLHLDIKKLGRFTAPGARAHDDLRRRTRGVGWDYVHVAIDDHSRIAFSAIHANEQGGSAAAFLHAAVARYARLGIRIRRVRTDNGPACHSLAFARACTELELKHRFTRPYTSRTNGKAERFIQTLCGSGPMLVPTKTLSTATGIFSPGCISTTGTDPMAGSAWPLPSPAPVWIGTTC